MVRSRLEPTYASVAARPLSRQSSNITPTDVPTPMEIEATRRRGPLSDEEKHRRRANRLCLYCGGPGHIEINCPNRPKSQVSQILITPESNPIRIFEKSFNSPTLPNRANNLHIPTLSNKFEVSSPLE